MNQYNTDGCQAERDLKKSSIALDQYQKDLHEVELERDMLLLGLMQLERKYNKNTAMVSDIKTIISIHNKSTSEILTDKP
jgi:CII-binding regulator of phage lambda lysogenization HflD